MLTQLELARRRKGMTTREVADVAGCSHATVSAVELGKWQPTEETAQALARAVGIDGRSWRSLQKPG